MRRYFLTIGFAAFLLTCYATQANTIDYHQNTEFGVIDEMASVEIRKYLSPYFNSKHCEKAGTKKDPRAPGKQYRCGELAYGKIVDNSKKEIYKYVLETPKLNFSGIDILVPKIHIPIMISRNFRTSTAYQVNSLNNRGKERFNLSKDITKNIHTRIVPLGDRLLTFSCIYVPGLEIFIPKIQTQVKGVKKIWFITLVATADVTMEIGHASFEQLNACATASVQLASNSKNILQPQMIPKIMAIQTPKVEGAKITGIRVTTKASDWFTAAVFWIAKTFVKYDIPEMIQKMVKTQIKDIKTKHIENGEWLLKTLLNTQSIAYTPVENLAKSFNEYLKHQTPGKPLIIKSNLDSICNTLVSSGANSADKTNIARLCGYIHQVELLPFDTSAASRKNRCFHHLMPLGAPKALWWKKSCTVTTTVRFQLHPSLQFITPLLDCLVKNTAGGTKRDANSVLKCKSQMDQAIVFLKDNPDHWRHIPVKSVPGVHVNPVSSKELKQRAAELGFTL